MIPAFNYFEMRENLAGDVRLEIPTEAGRGFRFDVGHRSDLKPATIPI
jgi:hypothetical protein